MKKLDLYEINSEFQTLLKKHKDDTDVLGPSRKEFLNVMSDFDDFKKEGVLTQEDFDSEKNFRAMAWNAYDELCSMYEGLRETYGWWYGAEFVGYDSIYDLYIGTGEETTNI
jgi:hypothetical protein